MMTFKILKKKKLNDMVVLMEIYAPYIAVKAKAGQFVIVRADVYGERIPLTIVDTNRETGAVTIIFQLVGRTTMLLGQLEEGDFVEDFTGPLGVPSELDGYKRVCVVGGGVGTAIALPCAKALCENNAEVDIVAGFKNKELVILEDEFKATGGNLIITTDNGSYGKKGFVTDILKKLIEEKRKTSSDYDLIVAIGPVPMMKDVSSLTLSYNIKTMVSLNPIMIDGTGMCGCCRVTVDGKVRFACVDGPDFDGHKVDFDELMLRNSAYAEQEKHDRENCRLFGG